jgi:hypothetical protein
MQFDKDAIVSFLREKGQSDQADQAAQNLPAQVDTDQHSDLLSQHGVDIQELVQKFGGGALGGLAGKL